jgi:hypothetical protein
MHHPTFLPPVAAYTIQNFCRAHDISRPLFYRLLADGRGPRTMRVGRRVLISAEAAADWRRAMECPSTDARA